MLTAMAPAQAASGHHLTVGVIQDDWPPFRTVVGHRLEGLSAAFLAKALGTDLPPLEVRKFPDQTTLLQAVCRGEVDVAPDVTRTPEREACLTFSESYYEGQAVVAAREDRPDLMRRGNQATATYAVESGFQMARLLRERYPHAKFLYVRDTRQALDAVATGRADLYVGLRPALEYVVRQSALRGLVLFGAHAEPGGELRFAFPRKRNALRAEVDAGLRRISDSEREQLLARWIAAGATPPASSEHFLLSDSERSFLAGLPTIKVSLVQWRPYSYLDQTGQQVGILPDYLAYFSQQLGVPFALQQLESPAGAGQAMDTGHTDIGVYAIPDDRDALPSGAARPIETYPVIVVGRRTDVTISGIAQLANRRVAVVKRTNNLELLRRDVPTVVPVVAQTIEDCLQLIRDGKADVFVGNLAAVDYLVQGNYAGDLKVLGPTGYEQAIGFQVRPGLEPLIPILNRALAAIPETQRLAIRNRYLTTSYQLGPSWFEILRRSGPFILLGGFAIAMLGFAYMRLRREVRLRHQSEQQLLAQLDFRRTLIDAVPIPLAVKDRDGRYLEINVAGAGWAGLDQKQMVGHLPTGVTVVGNEAAAALEAGARRALDTRQPQQFAVDYRETDGESRHFLCWAQPISGSADASAAVITAAVDVTEIRRAEEKARAAEAMLVAVTRQLPATVFQLRENEGKFSYQWASGNAMQLFGRAPETLIGQTDPMLDIVDAETRAKVLKAAAHAKATQQPLSEDLRFRVQGETRWIRVHSVPRADADGSILWSGYYADLTEDHARAQALARARDTAEAALRAKEGFLAMMSHEIRTPMNGILGLIELLQATALTPEQMRMVELARESGQALGQILDDILDYAKIEAGRLSITPAPLDVRELFDSVLGALLPKAFEKGLHLKQSVAGNVPAMVQADGIRLRQILFNLLGNAIKFTERGGVTLRAAVESCEDDAVVLTLAVEDTGIGISKENLKRLFAPFVQIERNATTRRFGGTGLGLTIARKLAELMKGELTLHSEEDMGTTAVLRVPCDVVTQQYAIGGLRGRTLLVLVGDPIKREALEAFAAAAGMRCIRPGEQPTVDSFVIVDQLARAAGWRRSICLTGELLPLGFRQDERGVWLASNPLRWTAFQAAMQAMLGNAPSATATFPATDEPAPLAESLPVVSILVVEDHSINQEVIQQQLRLLGYRATACANGQEALAALEGKGGPFDLVLTDCHMPVMDGFELTREIRASNQPRICRLPVIGLTATIAREEHLLCTIVGMDAFLIKPATLAALRDTIEECLQGCASSARHTTAPMEGDVPFGDAPPPNLEGFVAEHIDAGALVAVLRGILSDEAKRIRFRQALQADRAALLAQLESPSDQGLAEWCHHAGGGLSALQQPYLRELVNRFDSLVQSGSSAAVRVIGQSLVSMYDHLLGLLEERTSP